MDRRYQIAMLSGASPRMIAFVDACAGSRFLPQAAELNDGRVVTFFDPLIEI